MTICARLVVSRHCSSLVWVSTRTCVGQQTASNIWQRLRVEEIVSLHGRFFAVFVVYKLMQGQRGPLIVFLRTWERLGLTSSSSSFVPAPLVVLWYAVLPGVHGQKPAELPRGAAGRSGGRGEVVMAPPLVASSMRATSFTVESTTGCCSSCVGVLFKRLFERL